MQWVCAKDGREQCNVGYDWGKSQLVPDAPKAFEEKTIGSAPGPKAMKYEYYRSRQGQAPSLHSQSTRAPTTSGSSTSFR